MEKWDGEQWVRQEGSIARLRHLPTWLTWSLAAWLPLFVAWIPAVTVVASHHDPRQTVVTVTASVVTVSVLATITFGVSLGYRREWGYLWWSLLLGIAVTGLFIFIAFDSSQPANAPDDQGLGLGAMLVTAALFPVVTLLLWLGGGVGTMLRRLRS